ncbi:uncharacterized protein TNCV_2184491 [Trichonephila clavipes]|nr:uncharacterized protein TNCV_2184491 [Trichonephila clavipes]
MKNGKTVADYISRVREISTECHSLGLDVPPRKLVYYTVRGLNGKFSKVRDILKIQREKTTEEILQILREEETTFNLPIKTQETVYVLLSPGYEKLIGYDKVCELKKSIYSLPQSGRNWAERLVRPKYRTMDDPLCYELRVFSIATGTAVKCYSPKSFSSVKVSLELSFNRIMHTHKLQRLFETSIQLNACNFFLGRLIHRIYPLLSTCGLVGRRFARDPRPAASKDEVLLRIQAIWNSLPQADIQNLFDSATSYSSTY